MNNYVEKQAKKGAYIKELYVHMCFLIVSFIHTLCLCYDERSVTFAQIYIAAVTLNRSAYESYIMNQSLINAFINSQIAPSLNPFATNFLDIQQPSDFTNVSPPLLLVEYEYLFLFSG
jgi:hypothetical protein